MSDLANCVQDLVPVVHRLLALPEVDWQSPEEDVVRSVLSQLQHLPLSFAHFEHCQLAQRLSAKAATLFEEEEGITAEERTEKEERWRTSVAEELRAAIEKDTVRVDAEALLETRLTTSSSSAKGQFQSFSFFDFDDLPPLESLEEVLQGLRTHTHAQEEAWLRLLRFEHLDLLEHPQWREVPPLLRTALQSVAAAVREKREPHALTLTLYAICCRFLQAFAEHPQCAEVLQIVAEHCLICFHADRDEDSEENERGGCALTQLTSLSLSLSRESAALLALYAQLCVSLVSSSSCLDDETSNGVARQCILSLTQGCVTALCGERPISLLAVVCASHTMLPVALSLLQQCDVVMLHGMERKHTLLAVVDRALTVCSTQHSSPHTQLTQHNLSCGLLAVHATLRSRLSQRLSHYASSSPFHSTEIGTNSDADTTVKKQRYDVRENVPLSLLRRVLSEGALLSEPHVDAHWRALVRSLSRLVQSSSERECARNSEMSIETETETVCGIIAEMTLSVGRERGAESEAFRECMRLLCVVGETVSLPESSLSALTSWIEKETQKESSLRAVLRNLRRRERQSRSSLSFPAVCRLVRKVCRAATPVERDVTQLTTVTRECVLWAAQASHSELLALSRTVLDRLQRDPLVFENEHETLSWSNDRSAALLLFELVFSLVALRPALTQGLQIIEPENGEEEDLLVREPYAHRWDSLFAVQALRWLSRDSQKGSPELSCLVAQAFASIDARTQISPVANQPYFEDVSGQMRRVQFFIYSKFGAGCGIDPQALLRINSEPVEVDGLKACVVSMSSSVEQAQRLLRDIELHCELDVLAAAEDVVRSLRSDIVLTAKSLFIDCGLLALFLLKNWFAPFVTAVEMHKIACEFIARRYDLSYLMNMACHEIERIVMLAREQEIVGFENLLYNFQK